MKRFVYIVSILLFTGISEAMAQIPYHVPKPVNNTPVDLSNPADVIIYVVLPIIVVILAIISKRYKKNRHV